MPVHGKSRMRNAGEVLAVFLRLGCTSFGGPIAHLGFFRTEFVERRRWLTEHEYADLVTLCQFLPGPASSQVGFAIGLRRAGVLGALAAFVGFTAPSVALMMLFAAGVRVFTAPWATGALVGLMAVAVAIVAQAVWGMARTLAPDALRAGIALVAAALALLVGGPAGQLAAITLGVICGLALCRRIPGAMRSTQRWRIPRSVGLGAAVGSLVLVIGSVLLAGFVDGGAALFGAFAAAGSLVFGGGHVVLPLLHAGVVDPGWVSEADFLAGYGAAQAVPGPLFTFAAYLGDIAAVGPGGIAGALIGVAGIFLPGFLVLVAALSSWDRLREQAWMIALMHGANAAVVGILAAALYSPVFTSAITGVPQFLLALAAFVALVVWRTPPWAVVLVGAAAGAALALLP